MRILLTGGTGYLGSHVLKKLIHQKATVTVLKRSFSNIERIRALLDKVELFDVDRAPLETIFRGFPPFDLVLHVATAYGRKGESIEEIAKSNILFPLQLIDLAYKNGTKYFINTDTVLAADTNSYSMSKKQFKEWGLLLSKQQNCVFINVRLDHFYGPKDDDTKFTTYIIKSCLNNESTINLTQGVQKRDFIFIDDVVSAYSSIIEARNKILSSEMEFDVGTGHPKTIREFVTTVHHMTKSKSSLDFGAVPYRENELMETKMDMAGIREIGWKPRFDLIEGLSKTISSMQAG